YEAHMNQYLVDFENDSLSYSSVKAIMTDKLAGHSQNKRSRQSSSEPKLVLATAS
ncbi:13056_t:CDS:2, partial [Dentiscutata heterogama]